MLLRFPGYTDQAAAWQAFAQQPDWQAGVELLSTTEVVIGDWGFGKQQQVDPTSMTVLGTANFEAPEVRNARVANLVRAEYGWEVDVWSFGAMAIQLM